MKRTLILATVLSLLSGFLGESAADSATDRVERWSSTVRITRVTRSNRWENGTRAVPGWALVHGYGYREQHGY